MGLTDFELASQYQALDSNAAADGAFVNPHVLRAQSRSMNRIIRGRHHELLTLLFDTRHILDTSSTDRAGYVTAGLNWSRALPGCWIRPKLPGLNSAHGWLMAIIPTAQVVWLQVETQNAPIDLSPNGDADRTFRLVGTGGFDSYELVDIPIDEGAYERLGFWIRGEPTATPGDVSIYTQGGAGTNWGVVNVIARDAAASLAVTPLSGTLWNYGPGVKTWAPTHYVFVHDGVDQLHVGNALYQAQIVAVTADYSLVLYPPPSDDQLAAYLAGKYFEIRELPTIRIGSIQMACQARAT